MASVGRPSTKGSAAVNVTFATAATTGVSVSGTLYTVPANSYAVVNVSVTTTAVSVVAAANVSTRTMAWTAVSTSAPAAGNASNTVTLYLGPGQTLSLGQVSASSAVVTTVAAVGVEFVNS
jgi:hypothetical protein